MDSSDARSAGWTAEHWMTMKECAAALDTSESNARRLIRKGYLNVRVVQLTPRTTRVNREDVAAFIREKMQLADSA